MDSLEHQISQAAPPPSPASLKLYFNLLTPWSYRRVSVKEMDIVDGAR